MQHQMQVAAISGATLSVVASTALGADPAAVATWFWGAVDGLITRIQVGYAATRQATMGYLTQHAALNGARVLPIPGSLDVAALSRDLTDAGPRTFQAVLDAGGDTDEALRTMSRRMSNVADGYTRAGDRDVDTRPGDHGRQIVGWRRRLVGGACGFCAMLASRGAVYNTRHSATIARDGLPYHGDAHGGGWCRCWAEPGYEGQPEPASVQLLQRQWAHVTSGYSENGAINAWRRHWEQRATPKARRRAGIPDAAGRGVGTPGGPYPVRKILADAQSPEQVSRVLAQEYERITGRQTVVDLRGSVETAREHAEGVLQALDRFPALRLDRIETGPLPLTRFAEYFPDEHAIRFSEYWSTLPARQDYLSRLSASVERGFHPNGHQSPVGAALHEMGHALDVDHLMGAAHFRVRAVMQRYLDANPGLTAKETFEREISGYARKNTNEAMAEAFLDAMANGANARPLSRELFALMDDAYRRGLRGVPGIDGPLRTTGRSFSADAPSLRQLLDDFDDFDVTVPKRQVRRALEGEYPGGLRVEVAEVSAGTFRGERYISIDGVIRNAQGRKVGEFSREIRETADGQLIAEHHLLKLDRKMDQGSGFAEALNGNLMDWYERSSVAEIRLTANIDIGGYAWASRGFDFVDAAAAREFLDEASEKIAKALAGQAPSGVTKDELRELGAYIEDMRLGRRPAHAPDIARFGRRSGQGGKRDTWPGKWLMLGSDWKGRLLL